MFFYIVATMFPIFGIIFLGMFAARRKFLPLETAMCINQYVYWIGLPALMFNYLARMTPDSFAGAFFIGVYLSLLICYLICFGLTSSFFRKNKAEATQLSYMACFPNVAFMCIAMVSFLLPGNEEALLATTMYSMLNMFIMLYTDTKLEMDRHKGEKFGQIIVSLLSTVFRNPMILAAIFGTGISLLHISPPLPVMNMASMLGGTAAPCALFAMGMALNMQLTTVKKFPEGWIARQLPVHLVKLLLLPACTYLVLQALGISGVVLGVSTLASAMPVGVSAYVVAEKFQVAVADTSLGIFINTALSMLSIPLVMAAMFWLGAF